MTNQARSGRVMIEWAAAGRPIPGEIESGDMFVVKLSPRGFLMAVVDGLGHGSAASFAAQVAVRTLESHAEESIVSLVQRCHVELRRTRGVALTLASINTQTNVMTWLGVGNVEGVLIRRDPRAEKRREYVLPRGGVVGMQLPPLHASDVPILEGDTVILASDGISLAFAQEQNLGDPPQELADRILATYGKSTDDALVLVLRFVGLAA